MAILPEHQQAIDTAIQQTPYLQNHRNELMARAGNAQPGFDINREINTFRQSSPFKTTDEQRSLVGQSDLAGQLNRGTDLSEALGRQSGPGAINTQQQYQAARPQIDQLQAQQKAEPPALAPDSFRNPVDPIRPPTGDIGSGGIVTGDMTSGNTVSAQNIPTSYGPRPTTGNTALDAVYDKRSDLQQLYNRDGTVKDPNDPRVAGIPTLNDWMNQFGKNEEQTLGASQNTTQNTTQNSTQNTTQNTTNSGQVGTSTITDTTPAKGTDYQSLINQGMEFTKQSPEELATQQKIDDLTTSEKMGINAVNAEPIPYQTKYGTAQNIQAQANQQIETLTQKLARLQGQRAAALDAVKLGLGEYAPKEVPIGGTLVQRDTQGNYGTVASGQSYFGKQASAQILKLNTDYPDAGIDVQNDTPQQAAAKVSNSPSFQIKNSGQRATVNPLTGEIIFYNTKGPGVANNAGFANVPVPTSTTGGGSTSFTLGSDGRTVLANGTPVDLPTFKQMTGQQNVPDNKVNFSAVKGGVAQQKTAQRTLSNSSPSVPTSGLNTQGLKPVAIKDGQDLLNGTNPDDIATTYGRRTNAIAAARQMSNGLYDPTAVRAGQKFQMSPDTQKFIANANTATNTLDQLISLSDKVNRGNLTVLNNGLLKLKSGTGDVNTAKLVSLSSILADELGKILGSGQGSDFAIQLGQSLANPTLSKDQLKGVALMLQGRINNKIQEYKNQSYQNPSQANPNGHKSGDIVTGGDGKQYKVNPDGSYSPQ